MIQMPHRNVTRFFIPLIDVLILLFCIFLLMDFNAEAKVDKSEGTVEYQEESIKQMEDELRRRKNDLERFEQARPQLEKVDELLKKIAELEKANVRMLEKNLYVRSLDVDSKDGSLSFYDDTREQDPVIKIADKKSAQVLIERHLKEAKARGATLYYLFQPPRPNLGLFPTREQRKRYESWFDHIANSYAGGQKK